LAPFDLLPPADDWRFMTAEEYETYGAKN